MLHTPEVTILWQLSCLVVSTFFSLPVISCGLQMTMLPSMPSLFSSSRDSMAPAAESIPTKEINQLSLKEKKSCIEIPVSNELQNFSFECIPEDEKECDDELVLLAENSSIGEKRKTHSQTTPTRKKRKIETVEPLLDDRVNSDEQANHFAASYFMKAKAELDEPTFSKFISLLSDIEENKTNVTTLYSEMMELLSNYPDLAEEFIGFLHPHQAFEVEKFKNYMQFEHSWNFFRKIDAFHLNKVYHLLEQHISNPSVTSETVKNSLLSTFKGHPNISEGLLFLLPDEKPPASCKEDFDDISELGLEESSLWERLSIPELSNRGCSSDTCDCACHLCLPKKFCTFCNIKFSNGQIYVQTGKGLRFAKVTFRDLQQEEILWRLNPAIYSKPVERKRTKSLSQQAKENSHVSEPLSKSEVLFEGNKDVDKCKGTDKVDMLKEAPPARVEELVDEVAVEMVLPLVQKEVICMSEGVVLEEITDSDIMCVVLENTVKTEEEVVVISDVKEKHSIQTKQEVKEVNVDIEIEPGEIKEEKLENIENNIKDIIKNENENKIEDEKKDNKTRVWTREEDKLILQAFQKQLGTEQTFSRISDLMPNRTVDDIQGRFQVLMNLLEQMTSGSSYPS